MTIIIVKINILFKSKYTKGEYNEFNPSETRI